MARNGMGRGARTDRFGRPYKLLGAKQKKDSDFSRAYVDIGGHTFEIEIGPAEKDDVAHWIKVTKLEKRRAQSF